MKTQSGEERKYLLNDSTETVEFDEIRCPDCLESEATDVAKAYSDELVKAAEADGVTLPPAPPVLTCDSCGHAADRWHRIVGPGGIVEVPAAMAPGLEPYGFKALKAEDVQAARVPATSLEVR